MMRYLLILLTFFSTACTKAQTGILGVIVSTTPAPAPTGGYTVSATDPGADFTSLAQVSAFAFSPGDTISLKGGETFSGTLLLDESGTAESPIVVRSYGTGQALISAGTGDGVKLLNCGYVKVENLEIRGADYTRSSNATQPTSTGVGIHVTTTHTAGAKWEGVVLHNNEVHGTRTGILVSSDGGAAPQTAWRGYNDIDITNNEVHNCALTGILFWSRPNVTSDFGGVYPQVNGGSKSIFTNIYVAYNYVYNNYGYNTNTWAVVAFGTGIRTMNVTGGTVEYNRCDNNGHCGSATGMPANFEAEVSDGITWQYNESSRCQMTGGFDGAGFDVFDGGCDNMVLQYCYAWENDGYGIGGGGVSGYGNNANNIARFNVLVNNNVAGLEADVKCWGPFQNYQFYNNTVYSNLSGGYLVKLTADVTGYFANNIFITTGSKSLMETTATHPALLNNLYWTGGGALGLLLGGTGYNTLGALQAAGKESAGVSSDPLLAGAGTTPTFLPAANVSTMTAYKLGSGSPARNAGVNYSAQLGTIPLVDFYGLSYLLSSLNIGADQSD